ncbi:hypothetical protein [Sphingomonas sp. 10B4]|uniref:hypothetical protein n=1 Tax=Sphingomonas sp. 10B4 TaxID=3048575 RepID=UPI002AB531A6|nr:hypothetical protein [Sphingomonas sp. 10B4]MDY7525370.1 hypothetical protein [Sphingomonas sp. 10B4]MEB0284172.1 hypothetical protein [Sphingomonas sp. 10B4]
MRFFESLYSLVCAMCAVLVAFALTAITAGWGGMKGHFHLIPDQPRSIADTRRMGLA